MFNITMYLIRLLVFLGLSLALAPSVSTEFLTDTVYSTVTFGTVSAWGVIIDANDQTSHLTRNLTVGVDVSGTNYELSVSPMTPVAYKCYDADTEYSSLTLTFPAADGQVLTSMRFAPVHYEGRGDVFQVLAEGDDLFIEYVGKKRVISLTPLYSKSNDSLATIYSSNHTPAKWPLLPLTPLTLTLEPKDVLRLHSPGTRQAYELVPVSGANGLTWLWVMLGICGTAVLVVLVYFTVRYVQQHGWPWNRPTRQKLLGNMIHEDEVFNHSENITCENAEEPVKQQNTLPTIGNQETI